MKNISIFESKFLKKSFLTCIKYGPPILAICVDIEEKKLNRNKK